jgi:hypothetical protein
MDLNLIAHNFIKNEIFIETNMNKTKLFITVSLVWIIFIGYLTWFNGIQAPGRYKGFNWEEWFWFGILPATVPYIFYSIWKPESLKNFVNCIKSVFKS